MKQYAIRRTYGYRLIGPTEIDDKAFAQRLSDLDEALREVHERHGFTFIWSDTRFIPQQKMSAAECESCGRLMINRDRNPVGIGGSEFWADATDDGMSFIRNGGTEAGKELCEECLPISHRWGHFS